MKSISFDQVKTMLKSMSHAIFKRMGAMEDIVKPPSKPPFMQYVTDAEGNAKWEERTHYHEHSESTEDILPETEAMDIEGELYITGNPFVLEVGSTYKVTYNGVSYECVAFALEGVCLGNGKAVDASLPGNDEPFVLMSTQGEDMSGGAVESGAYGIFIPLEEATNYTISITRETVTEELRKIPNKFLPEQKFGEVEEEIVFLPETTVQYGENAGFHFEQFIRIPEPGQSIIATYDGVDYECMVYRSTNGNYDIAFGNSKNLGGAGSKTIPFGIGIISKSGELYGYIGASFEFRCDDSNEHTLKIHWPVGYVQRIPLDYIPLSILPMWVVKSTAYDAIVNGEEAPAENEYYSDLAPSQIVEMLKTGRIGGMMLYYYNADDVVGYIVKINAIRVMYRDTDDYLIECFASTPTPSSTIIKWTVTYDHRWNTYSVSRENV